MFNSIYSSNTNDRNDMSKDSREISHWGFLFIFFYFFQMRWETASAMDNQTGDLNTSISAADDATTKNSFYYIRLVCYVLIFIVGVIGNILVCLVVCRERKMKNVTNYFIFNLAVSDLSVLLICIPFDFGEIVTGTFPYGAVMCRLIYPLQTMAATASVNTLDAISLNR